MRSRGLSIRAAVHLGAVAALLVQGIAFPRLALSQEENPVRWNVQQIQKSRIQNSAIVWLRARIEKSFHLYPLATREATPTATRVNLATDLALSKVQIFQPSLPKGFDKQVVFPILVQFADVNASTGRLKITIRYSSCSAKRCYPPAHKSLTVSFGGLSQLVGNGTSVPAHFSDADDALCYEAGGKKGNSKCPAL